MNVFNCNIVTYGTITLNVYTHLGLEDAAAELHRLKEVRNACQEMNRTKDEAV